VISRSAFKKTSMLTTGTERYGSAPTSQILAQRDPSTFPEHYQDHCSSIDTVSAILDEAVQTKHIEYFQGYSQFCVPGLPLDLPAQLKESIMMLPELVEMKEEILASEVLADHKKTKIMKRQYRDALSRQCRDGLKKYQDSWVQGKRDQDIINRTKGSPVEVVKDICTRAQYLLMPELARIAKSMSCASELTFEEKLLFVEDLYTLCLRKEDVLYLPNEEPIEGHCPFNSCQYQISK
jgi:hypothetical protein